MNLIRCNRGHFFDLDVYKTCPYCKNKDSSKTESIYIPSDNSEPDTTLDDSSAELSSTQLSFVLSNDDDATVMLFPFPTNPAVGWIVCIQGSDLGNDFKLKQGKNFIGRSNEMDVQVTDVKISRHRHAVIVYDHAYNKFYVQSGDSHELFYINDSVVLNTIELKNGDILKIGDSKFIFIALCTDSFNWDKISEAYSKNNNI